MFAALSVAGCAREAPPQWARVDGEAYGSTWSVVWRADQGGPSEDDVAAACSGVLSEVEQAISTWRPDSDLSRAINSDGPTPVSFEALQVVRASLDVADLSGGAFDPTVGPLVELFGLHGARPAEFPSDEAIDAARAQVGWRRVRTGVDGAGPWIDVGGARLDVSAIAPGHAADRVSGALSALGLANHLVEVGGELRASGVGPSGGWRVGVDRPAEGVAPGTPELVLSVMNVGVATSGNYRNRFVVDGRPVVHTLDPRVGRPVETDARSATVVAPDARTADAWATVLMVLGTDGLPLVERLPGVDALILTEADAGFARHATTGMSAWVVDGG